jgi:NADPH:quinone reductase-like Zn-dependent oxidoreductase
MKAIVHKKYGPPEVADLKDVERPVPGDDEVLIKVYASTVNRTDSGLRSASYFISRFFTGLLRPKYQTLGCEFAGKIVEKGKSVTLFNIGDRIFGFNDKTFGGHAEYLTIGEKDAIATIPEGMTYHQSAPITEGSHYALNSISASKIKPGQRALVNGATGAIGSAAVQILKDLDVHVVAVCNTNNLSLVKSLGADYVIDYQKEDFRKIDQKFEFVFDAVGKSSFKDCKPMLTENGVYISTELGKNSENVFLAMLTSWRGGKRVLFPIPSMDKATVEYLKSLVVKGSFRPVIDRTYLLEEIVEAYRYVETGQKTGNVVLDIASENQ